MPLKSISLYQTLHDVERISRIFGIEGEMIEGGAFGNGLINDTLAATFEQAGGKRRRYILQRINRNVFRDPVSLMQNVERVCTHIRSRLEQQGVEDINRRALTLVRTPQGEALHIDKGETTGYWRCYRYINQCTSHDVVRTTGQAFEAASKFGEFQRLVADLPGPRLVETIPDFHNTPKRFQALREAIHSNPHGRAAACRDEINFALERATLTEHLLALHHAGHIPERITHNDTKLANVLIDDVTGHGMCVVDLDTVMPGLSLYDFGDMVRTCASPAEEDSTDLSEITVRLPFFEALARGFLGEMNGTLTPAELANLVFAGRLITFELGIRFLTDHLLGDTYFATRRHNHNLDRARNQFELVRRLEQAAPEMRDIVETLANTRINPAYLPT